MFAVVGSARRVGPGSSIFDMHMHTLSRPLVSMCLSRPLALMSLSTVAASSLSVEPLKTRLLGASSLRVTEACLGTMTWGVQNSEADGHAQLDYAIKE